MKKIWCILFAVFLMGSEDKLEENIPKSIPLTKEQRALLEESGKQNDFMQPKQENIKGSTQLQTSKNPLKSNNTEETGNENPYEGYDFSQQKQKQDHTRLVGNEDWIYGTAVITTTFLDGAIKRGYGILLHDGLYLTSANMLYNKNIYPRTSYAMMQDDSSPPFICIAKLSLKALDLQKGLAVLETLEYTDEYCNIREKSFYHDKIYSKNWIDVFDARELDKQYSVLYSATISPINSFQTKIAPLKGRLEDLAYETTSSFEGYKYPYGKGYYTKDGQLVGIVGANIDDEPHIVKTKEIANFLCELKDKKILDNHFLQILCPQKELGEKTKD